MIYFSNQSIVFILALLAFLLAILIQDTIRRANGTNDAKEIVEIDVRIGFGVFFVLGTVSLIYREFTKRRND